MNVTDFLLARLDGDALAAHPHSARPYGTHWSASDYDVEDQAGHPVARSDFAPHIARHDPDRVLRQVEKLRRVVEEHLPDMELHHHTPQDCPICYYAGTAREAFPCPTIRALAAIWSDHPDYDPDWRI